MILKFDSQVFVGYFCGPRGLQNELAPVAAVLSSTAPASAPVRNGTHVLIAIGHFCRPRGGPQKGRRTPSRRVRGIGS